MMYNYVKLAFRNLKRYRFFSFVNIFGFAISMSCCIIIFLYVKNELSYDKHNKDSGNIYRVVKDFVNDDGSTVPDATTPPALAVSIQKDIPEVEKVVRLFPGWGRRFYVRRDENKFIEENIYRADDSFFDVFTVSFLQGSPKTAFSQLKSIVITKSTAEKYFGKADPIGKSIELDDMGTHYVSAVIEDIPETSHFNFDFLISTRTIGGEIDQTWGFYNFYTYIKLKENASIAGVEAKIKSLFKKAQPENKNIFYTQPLTAIHQHSDLKWELKPNGNILYTNIFIAVGIFIIIIACINYINLSTARASLRAKEIGIRKVSGALKGSLTWQFLTESVVITLIASLIALGIAGLALPSINAITGKHLTVFSPNELMNIVYLIVGVLFIGFIAGVYPSIYLSSVQPVKILKGLKLANRNNFNLRRALVITQFTISAVLITGAVIINRQVDFIQEAKLGFNKEQVVIIPEIGSLSRSQRLVLRNKLSQLNGVGSVAMSDGIIGGQNWTNSIRFKGSQNSQLVNFLNVDKNFMGALSIDLKEGRNFSDAFPNDSMDAIILNETAVKQLGVPSPAIGQQIVWAENQDTTYYAKVIGVVKDFHFTSLHNAIKPFAFVLDNSRQFYFVLKLKDGDLNSTIANIKSTWAANTIEKPFQYFFLDETFDRLYRADRNFRAVFLYLTGLIIIIACLGLFGLASFMTSQRTKEIGIRKVLGSTVAQIVSLLSKDLLKLVLISNIIAWPIAWYILTQWLQDFAYKTTMPWWIFALASGSVLFIAFLTISFQTIRAAIVNPTKSLRTE